MILQEDQENKSEEARVSVGARRRGGSLVFTLILHLYTCIVDTDGSVHRLVVCDVYGCARFRYKPLENPIALRQDQASLEDQKGQLLTLDYIEYFFLNFIRKLPAQHLIFSSLPTPSRPVLPA